MFPGNIQAAECREPWSGQASLSCPRRCEPVRPSVRPAEKTESAELTVRDLGLSLPVLLVVVVVVGGQGGPVPGKIGLETQSVAGPAPHLTTSQVLFYRKLRDGQPLQ